MDAGSDVSAQCAALKDRFADPRSVLFGNEIETLGAVIRGANITLE